MNVRATFEFLRQWRVLIQVLFMVALTGVYVWIKHNDFLPLQDIEDRAVDWRLQRRGNRPVPDDVVILGVGESSFPKDPWPATALANTPELAYFTEQWPWNRVVWGKLADRLLAAGAREVVFDLTFLTPNPGDVECEKVFERQASHIVIAGFLDEQKLDTSHSSLKTVYQINDPTDDILPMTGPEIVGMANVLEDHDGLVRSLRHGYNLTMEAQPKLATDPKFLAQMKLDAVSLSWLAAEKTLGAPPPLNPIEPMLLNFYGEDQNTFNIIPIEDVLINWDGPAFQHGAVFKGKTVFIGSTAETRMKDAFDTPMGRRPGVELQATAYANLIKGEWLRPAASWVAPVLALIFGLLALVVSLRMHAVLGKIGLLIGFGLIFLLVTQWLFTHYMLIVPVTGTFLGLVGCGGFGTIYDFVLERYESRRMRGMFETMVSPGVANLVLSHRDDFEQRLGGQRRKVVILFSDIRGFTTWSEEVGPDALVTQLNEYFYEMVEVIQQEGGTVQKYIGDAVMVAWGDVREQPLKECATQAVKAAFRMDNALRELNERWLGQPKRKQLSFGIGINLEEALIGRIGHPRRQEFTVMGDAVNLAARLESATKQYHQTILVGENIYTLTKDQFEFRLADKMKVKGKTVAVPVYAPIGPQTAIPSPGLNEYNAAIEKYYSRDFSRAAELFKSANTQMGGSDYLCESFLERIADFLVEPPPPDWDGGWTLTEK